MHHALLSAVARERRGVLGAFFINAVTCIVEEAEDDVLEACDARAQLCELGVLLGHVALDGLLRGDLLDLDGAQPAVHVLRVELEPRRPAALRGLLLERWLCR